MSRIVQWFAVVLVVAVLGFVGTAVYREQLRRQDSVAVEPTVAPFPSATATGSSSPLPQLQPALNTSAQPPAGASAQPATQEKPAEAKPPVARKGKRTWSEVEAVLDRIRASRKEHPTAVHDLSQAYREIVNPAFTDSADFPTHCAELGKWRDELPESPTPLIVLAAAHVDWAWQARGSGFAYTVSEEGWNLFHTRIDEASKLLTAAIKLGPKDGEAHRMVLLVGMAEGAPDEQMREWFDNGRKLDPTYFPLYEQMAVALMPRWGGTPGDVERFAAEVAGMLPGDDGLEFFGLIAHAIHCYECNDPTTILWGEYDRKLLAQAADVLAKRYPESQGVVQFAALCSLVCQDHATAQRIRPIIGAFNQDYRVFAWQNTHQEFLNWSAAKTIPGGEESSFRAALAGCVDMSFADDSRHIWVGHQFGARSVTLMDAQTGKIEFELPHPGGVVNHTLFDDDRKLVLLAAWRGPFVGWMLFDFENPAEPIMFRTDNQVLAIALNPKQRQVVWSEATKLRLLDLTAEEQKTIDIELPQVHFLKFSADGTRLAIGGNFGWTILEANTGKELFKLFDIRKIPRPDWTCGSVLDIDDEGRIWAIASASVPKSEYRVVRYSADGERFETILPDIGKGFVKLSPDRKLLAITRETSPNSGPCGIDLYDISTGKRVAQLGGHWLPIGDLQFSADGQKLASIPRLSDVIKVWSLAGFAPEVPAPSP